MLLAICVGSGEVVFKDGAAVAVAVSLVKPAETEAASRSRAERSTLSYVRTGLRRQR